MKTETPRVVKTDVPKFGISFSGVAKPLIDQFKVQGFNMDRALLKQFQEDTDSIIRLFVRGLMTDRERACAEKRLFKQIQKSLEVIA